VVAPSSPSTFTDTTNQEEAGEEDMLKKPVFMTMEEFCEGHFFHYLKVGWCGTCGSELVLEARNTRHKKQSAWRFADMRVRRSLPVVRTYCWKCNDNGDKVIEQGDVDIPRPCIVKVTYEYLPDKSSSCSATHHC